MAYNNPEQAVEHIKDLILADPAICKENKKLLEEHLVYLKADGKNIRTAQKHLYCLKHSLHSLGKVSVKKASRKDMEKVMAKLEESELAIETKRNIRAVTKAFFKHAVGEDLQYPLAVAWIHTSQNKNTKRLPDSLLIDAEIQKLIECAMNLRDRAIIALLADSGIRIGELLGMQYKSVELNEDLMHIQVFGKTGGRKILLTDSAPHLITYMNLIGKKEPNAPLWYKIGDSHQGIPYNEPMDYRGCFEVLREVKKRAKITKRCNPHSFRHYSATKWAAVLTEQELKVRFGWTGGSKEAATYVHLNDTAMDGKILAAMGKGRPDFKPIKSHTKICWKCHVENSEQNYYCQRCGTPLDKVETAKDTIRETLLELVKDPKFFDKLKLDAMKEQRKR